MHHTALHDAARELYRIHGILPVAAAGKKPMGGEGWNMLPLEMRLLYFDTPACTGLGLQSGPILHPYYGWCDMRWIDIDEREAAKRDAFKSMLIHLLGDDGLKLRWRWGRGPACVMFTRGHHTREKYGSIQFLGPGKYAVGWGAHAEVGQYRWPDGDIFSVMPPLVDVKRAEACFLAACHHAGITVTADAPDIKLAPTITEQQLNALSDDDLARYQNEITSELRSIGDMPPESGRGTRLYNLGLRYGALARHDERLGRIVADALARLPGHAGQGDVRDFSRGLDESKGLAQQRTAEAAQQRAEILEALKPKGANAPGQELSELLRENIPPLRWLVNRFLPHVGTLALVGKPKIGKSYLVLELALSLCEGGFFWGEMCNTTGVLLYMLEDGKRRIKQRVGQLRPDGPRPKATFRIRYGRDGPFRVNPDGSGGLLNDIRKHKHDFADIGFVVVDMYKLVRGAAEKGLDAYQATSQIVAPISALAQELDITILLVHHARKGKIDPDDVGDAASGSNALSGATEGHWTIWREGDGARIIAEVRESENFDLQLTKAEGQLVWNPIASPEDRSTMKEHVYAALVQAGCELMPSDLALRIPNTSARVINARLQDLRNEGAIQNPRHSIYRISNSKSRIDGVATALVQSSVVKPVTTEIRAKYDPDGKYSHISGIEATGFAFTDDVISAIDRARFAEGKATVNTMHIHRVLFERKGIVWFFGDLWKVNRAEQPLPWAIPQKTETKMPWMV
jgi:hypothetical protein